MTQRPPKAQSFINDVADAAAEKVKSWLQEPLSEIRDLIRSEPPEPTIPPVSHPQEQEQEQEQEAPEISLDSQHSESSQPQSHRSWFNILR